MPEHPATIPIDQLLAECDERRTRRSGPGGQHRNKVETAVVLRHRPTGIEGEGHERRSLAENRSTAVFRLRRNLALAHREEPPEPLGPTALWQQRCPHGQIVINPAHDHFPALLAEALDLITAVRFDVRRAGEVLGCTPSQLIKLLHHEPRALVAVNAGRKDRGLRALS